VSLGQVAVEGKGNEITAIPKLLELLDLDGALVTIDAIGCQREVAARVVVGGGDYVLAVKENQPTLHAKVKALLDEAILGRFDGMSHGYRERTDAGHGRIETRRVWVTDEVHWLGEALLAQWPGLSGGSVGVVEAVRQDLGDLTGRVTTERRYFISSRAGTDVAAFADAVRGHWSIENRLHWQLDVSFREDERRIRKGHGAENYSRLCRLVLNLLKRDQTVKIGVHGKRLKAGWDEHYLLRLLTG
jgi:predicted transposase YbfD/YdcC